PRAATDPHEPQAYGALRRRAPAVAAARGHGLRCATVSGSSMQITGAIEGDADAALGEITLRKVGWRLLPFLLLLYVVAWLDRVNIGFAALQMNADLGFSATVFGFGAGIFFIGY